MASGEVRLPPSPDGMSPDIARGLRLRLEFERQSDRGVAILGAALLDSELEEALKSRLENKTRGKADLFNSIFNNDGPLGSFSSRIKIAYAMNLIGSHTYADLEIIRGIRNDFAHKMDYDDPINSLGFETQSIAARCRNLWYPKNVSHEIPSDTHRGMFSAAVWSIGSAIYAMKFLANGDHNVVVAAMGSVGPQAYGMYMP